MKHCVALLQEFSGPKISVCTVSKLLRRTKKGKSQKFLPGWWGSNDWKDRAQPAAMGTARTGREGISGVWQ